MAALRLVPLMLLVLVLAAGTSVMAGARHQARGVGEVVICTGYGLTTISVDAHGNPVPGRLILCPDCMPGLAALTDPVLTQAETPSRLTPLCYTRIDLPMPGPGAPGLGRSRAPPVRA